MDVVWLILDSLSAESTPFVAGGPKTMPKLEKLAAEHGIVYTHAHVPGPASPSSHGSFLTGEPPSVTGMHEASPYFNAPELETIAGALANTHNSFAISSNPFIFNGLDRDFDHVDDLRNRQYLLFESASDPGRIDEHTNHDSALRRYVSFILKDGKPFRSLLNGLSYRRWQRGQVSGIPKSAEHDEVPYQYAKTMNRRIHKFIKSSDQSFVLANYMDVHPPLAASDDAIVKLAPNYKKEELPIGVRGRDVHAAVREGDTELGKSMEALYRASIWDLDQKIASIVEWLISQDTFVVVTADHGSWFRRSRELEDRRIHVPLLLFVPSKPARRVTETVNIRSLPGTTMEVLTGDSGGFSGPSLLDIIGSHLSLTEYIHDDSWGHGPVNTHGDAGQVRRDIAAIRGTSRVDLLNGDIEPVRGSDADVEEISSVLSAERESGWAADSKQDIEYDDTTTDRLRELGYLE